MRQEQLRNIYSLLKEAIEIYPGEVNGVSNSKIGYELKQGDLILNITYSATRDTLTFSSTYYLTVYWKGVRIYSNCESNMRSQLSDELLESLLEKIEKGLEERLKYLESSNDKFFEELEKFEFEF